MKAVKYTFVAFYVLLCILCAALLFIIYYYDASIDDEYKISKGMGLNIETGIPVTAEYNGARITDCEEIFTVGNKIKVDVKLLGIIPIKSTTVEVVEENYVVVLGSPFGVKIFTDGVLVVDVDYIPTSSGKICPANDAGIKKGDYIYKINGKSVATNEDIADAVKESNGKKLSVEFRRDGKNMIALLVPVLDVNEKVYKAGLWVKDSAAGLGTLTFYSPYNDIVCGLGHGVYERKTDTIIDFSRGELVGAQILSVIKGTVGVPGELKGTLNYSTIGPLKGNFTNGIYASAGCFIDTANLTQVAHKQDVKSGAATIICTVDGNTPRAYTCQIKVATVEVNDTVQDMYVTITDKELIKQTGGIVQGMSGSPIVQNGKLVGVLTHVLIDNPEKGYGIFAENMLETAQSVAKQQLKEVS